MAPKIYSTLAEAFEDIGYEKEGLSGKFSCGHIPPSMERDDALGYITGAVWNLWGMPANVQWAIDNPKKFPHFKEKRVFLQAVFEFFKNADSHCPQIHKDKLFWVETYIGKRGILTGTRQEAGFFTPEQIRLLKQGQTLEGTREDSYGTGLSCYIWPSSDGILILEKEQAIYASKILENPDN